MKVLRVVVVDDEQLGREGMVELLERIPGLSVVGAFGDARSTLAALDQLQADLLLLDIQMPGMSGLELVEALPPGLLPAVVFVTAHDAYAIRAFEVHALDYLLKPVSLDRLNQTIDRVRGRAVEDAEESLRRRVTAVLATLMPDRPSGVSRLIVREVGQIVIVATRDVDWIEGADYYARLHVGQEVHLLREPLRSLEERLDARQFMRVHRSTIVNLSRVRSVEAHERGAGVVVLTTGARLKVSSERREELEQRLEAGDSRES